MSHIFNLLLICFITATYTSFSFAETVRETTSTTIEKLHNMTDETEILKRYASYNRWANEQFIGWFQGVSDEIMKQEVNSSFPSLYLTLLHIWDAEYGWLNTVLGEPWGTPPGRNFEGSMNELFTGFLETSTAFETAVNRLDAEDFQIRRPDQETGTRLDDIILHLFNHSTFHRGQLITIGRQVGLTQPPRSDYIYYVRQMSRQ